MTEPRAEITFNYIPYAHLDEDGLYYPAVEWWMNDNPHTFEVYEMSFDTPGIALTMARTLAADEAAMWKMSMDGIIARLKGKGD